ncbi:heavy-metal-associated domain-containing protein [Apibacter muscae]|uniref:Heavy-metal-associated domain-containing protein n=1 Tax=Apibacter muscae TaxID=2509004 RepID=A0A563DB41_9FLAO|nr:heavy metal-associated domain-containing protein [Apibacter muscae]TWP27307.1 heavy-metal-associated domain-containing protein [Apibacter muscae]TWP28528.1 heavy-metal-associated domain-containing protein [Apibacter muscae]
MSTLKFKTNIDCGGCVKAVTPSLSKVEGITKWEVDTTNPEKILTVEGSNEIEEEVVKAVKKAGFTIKKME